MIFHVIWLLTIHLLPRISCQESANVNITIRGSAAIAETSDNFICATIDWWPSEKCDYGQCPWGQASALNLDLTHPFLVNAIQAFSPLRIRVGGSLQDQVVYGVKNMGYPCKPFSKMAGGLFGFSKGCLSMERWDALNSLFMNTGAVVTFGVNALRGRHHIRNGVWGGSWNSTNARDFIEYTVSKGYPVDSWEFGNELSGHGVGARVDAEIYGKDVMNFRAVLDELYENEDFKPLLVAPGGFFEKDWYAQLLRISGLGVVNAMTHHIYNLGGGNDPNIKHKIIDPEYLNRVANTYRDVQLTVEKHGPWSSAWVGEAGGAFNSGSRLVSSSFLNSLWYLDQLGMASKYNTKVYCRQSLIGGYYGLLDTKTFIPNPDYYSALLWHLVMGKEVLSVDFSGSPYLRAYAHCRKIKGGVTLMLINLNRTTSFSVNVHNDLNTNLSNGESTEKETSFEKTLKRTVSWVGKEVSADSEMREEYHLTAKDGNHLGRTMLLNRNILELTEDGHVPELIPVLVRNDSPVIVDPLSIVFVVFPNFDAQACT